MPPIIAILLALALVKKLYTRTYLRTIFYIPAVLSYVVVGIMFTAMFQMNGTFNQILNAFGIPCTKEWLASGDTALLMVIVEDVWKWTGFHMIIYIAGLQAIPTDLYEAAKIDGCPNLVFIVRILIPLTKSAIGAMAVYTFINAYNMYMWPLLVTGTEEMRTVQIGISMLNSVDSQSITMVIAGVVMVILPSLFVFILGQKQLIRGMFSGAVKG